jgi:hypothetical protein
MVPEHYVEKLETKRPANVHDGALFSTLKTPHVELE